LQFTTLNLKKHGMKNKLFVRYALFRGNVLSTSGLQGLLAFLRLPEFKFMKTLGFIVSVLL